MGNDRKLALAIAAALGGVAVAVAAPSDGGDQLQTITVTAQRRVENMQDVPITIQALTSDTLKQLNVTTFDDAIKFLPNVSFSGTGPGQNNIFMRGLATSSGGIQGAGAVGSFPNVAIYLDDQSGQSPGRNLDIYAADMQRIEVLEGPQGTLFGAGAQAGVVRYITNKPVLDRTEAKVNAGYAVTAHGDPSTNVDATVNLPIIPDKFAVRAVIYSDSRGGYIDNIPGTFTRAPTDRGIAYYFKGVVPPGPSLRNDPLVARAINPVTYKGGRIEAAYKFNEDWNALLSQSYQNLDAEGVFWQEEYDGLGQPLPSLSVQLYNPSYNKDRFSNTAWTLNGRIDQLKLVYTGGYLDRHADQQQDYTNYSRGQYAEYYQCNVPGSVVNGVTTPAGGGNCYSPSGFWTDHQLMTHQSHELRVSTPDDWRFRALGGLFWEDYTVHEQTDWYYGTNPNFVPIAPPPGVTANNPNVRPQGDSFFDDITRGYKQKAAFVSMDYDILPKTLTLTLGTRYYSIENFEVGSNVGSYGCNPGGIYSAATVASPCTIPVSNGNNLNAKNLDKTYSGFKSRANLTWHITPEAMAYYTWSQGFRPGGFNRAQSIIKPSSPIYGLFTPPLAYAPDTLTNNELGWKTQWFDNRLQFNGAVYQEDWNNVQIEIFDPGVTGNLTFTTNGPSYRVRGLETSFIARVTHGLTLSGAASWNSSEVVKTLSLVNPTTGQPIQIANPFGALGTPLAQSPPFEANLRARYEFKIGDYHAFWQVAATHQSHSYATTDHLTTTLQGKTIAFDDPGFSTYDASIGASKGAWSAQLYGRNLTDVRAVLFASYAEYVKMDTVNVPRTIGVSFSYSF
ncbi:MAG: TonB-dependent receptor [Gammaproteobacteria bacterium]|nr:TonB-dependent receptor [Gammaproteobacteria bacterium]